MQERKPRGDGQRSSQQVSDTIVPGLGDVTNVTGRFVQSTSPAKPDLN